MKSEYLKWVHIHILEEEAHRVKAELSVDKDFPAFRGHFPKNPVLPAVSIIDLSLILIERLEEKHSFSDFKLEKTRFKSMILPEQKVQVEVESLSPHNWSVVWRRTPQFEECVTLKVCF